MTNPQILICNAHKSNFCPKGERVMVLDIIIKNIYELSIENIRDIISILIPFIALIVSICSFISTNKTSRLQREVLEKQKLPNLTILSIETTKSNPQTSSVKDGSHCRIYEGSPETDISLNNSMATYKSTNTDIDLGFINELKTHITRNKKDVYLTYFFSKPYLMIQHATDPNDFIIDHSNVKITFHNYGAIITALSIERFKVYYNPEIEFESQTFEGMIEQKITLTPEENDSFILFFDEITTNFNNSMCRLPEHVYNSTPDSFDILKAHTERNVLRYNKLEITLICWDIYNNPIKYLITVEHNGNFFISTTTLLSK